MTETSSSAAKYLADFLVSELKGSASLHGSPLNSSNSQIIPDGEEEFAFDIDRPLKIEEVQEAVIRFYQQQGLVASLINDSRGVLCVEDNNREVVKFAVITMFPGSGHILFSVKRLWTPAVLWRKLDEQASARTRPKH
jgi:hypothetical protein